MAVSMDALAAIAEIEDEREAQEPGPVELDLSKEMFSPSVQAAGEEVAQAKREGARQQAFDVLDHRLGTWAGKTYGGYTFEDFANLEGGGYLDNLMDTGFITDVSLGDGSSSKQETDVSPGYGLMDSRFAETNTPLNKQRVMDKFSFYLDDGNFGATFSDPSSPYGANFNINEQGQVNWGGSVTGEAGPFNAKVGLLGQGMQFSPYANLGVSPVEGLNLNVQGQSYPGGYSQVSPSASYMNQFDTPWGSVDYNIGRQGGRTVGGFNVRGDF